MKNIFITITLLFFSLIAKTQYSYEYQSTTVKTPTGVDVNALQFKDWIYDDFDEDEIAVQNYNWTSGYNCEIIENSTKYHNCHGYAWHNIEGNISQSHLRWINDVDYYGNPTYNVHRYYSSTYSGGKPAYKQIGTNNRANFKVSYFPRDHSAVTTSNSQYFLSKWAWGPLVKHKPEQCPFYSNAQIKYYELNPIIQGSTMALCNSQTRTFSENSLTNISLNYQWSNSSLISTQSGGTGYNYNTVKANSSGNGSSSITLTVTSPSGSSATSVIYFGVGVPTVPIGIIGFCCNGMEFGSESVYEFTVNHANNQSVNQYYWIVAGGTILEGQGTKTITVKTVKVIGSQRKYFDVSVRVGNSCGWSSYLWRSGYVTSGVGPAMFSVYPNPANNEVTISVADAQVLSEINTTNEIASVGDVIIYDSFGTIKKIKKTNSNQESTTIDVSDLQKGTYLILINSGSINESHILIIE